MIARFAILLSAALVLPPAARAQGAPAGSAPPRAIRRDIPITNAIRRPYAAGTRDSSGRPGENYWQLETDYTIRVSLDPASQRLTGSETITIHNASPDSLRNIVLRMDPNLFLGVTPHLAPWVPAEITDGMRVTRMVLDGAPVNLNPAPPPQGQSVSENGYFSQNLSSTRIALAKAIPAGAVAKLEIDWNHKIPGGPGSGHRMTQRWADTLFQPTQWYPRVAVYDDLRGWDTELYLGPSEFYNNFGRFDVSIEVPAGWIVSGTGVLQNPNEVLTEKARQRLATVLQTDSVTTIVGPEEIGPGSATASGDRLTWHLLADKVNDFAWATAKKFVWEATRATIPGKGPVPVNLYYLPGRAQQFAGAGQIARHALEFYSKLWFPYPFPQLTLQDGPSAGMEYPMVINSNRGAADHETGHQWWPMTVSNNETWYGWMDEGYNEYMNILSGADTRGLVPNLNGLGQSYGRISGNEAEPPMMWNANYAGPAFYGFTTYSKTPLMLSMLGGIVGDSVVQRAHREWAQAWMWKHPSPWDWMFFMNKTLKRDLGWFWYYWLFTTESVDGSIANLKTVGSRATITVRQDGQMPSPVVLEVKLTDSTVVVTAPVEIWFDGKRSHDIQLELGNRKIEKVTLDPCGRFPDRDPSDNVWPRLASPATLPTGSAGRGQNSWPSYCTEK